MMETTILASAGWSALTVIGVIVLVAVELLLIGLVLLQKNRGSGLSGAFGGAGGHTAFGTKTGDFLTWVTVALVTVFLVLAILLNFAFEPTTMADTSGVTAADTTDTSGADATGDVEGAGATDAPAPASDSPATPGGG